MRLVLSLLALVLGFATPPSKAGEITQTTNFSNLSVAAPCSGGGCSQNNANEISYGLFQNFNTMIGNAGLSGVLLTQVTWHLQGVLRAQFSSPQFPSGVNPTGFFTGSFPWRDIPIPGGATIPRLSFNADAPFSCVAGSPCFVEAETPFDITIHATDFAPYFTAPYFAGYLSVEIFPQYFPGLLNTEFVGTFSAGFAGNANTFSLTYTFLPEPGTFVLVGIALLCAAISQRRRLSAATITRSLRR